MLFRWWSLRLRQIVRDLGCVRIRTGIAGLPFPHHGWLEQPFQEDIRWDRVALSTDAGEDIRRFIYFSDHMVEFEPLEPSLHFEDDIALSHHFWVLGIKVSVYLRFCKVRVPMHF